MPDDVDELEPMGSYAVIRGRTYRVDGVVRGRMRLVGDETPPGVPVLQRGFGEQGSWTSVPLSAVESRYQVAWEAQVDGVWASVLRRVDGLTDGLSFDPDVATRPGWEGDQYDGWTKEIDLADLPVRSRRCHGGDVTVTSPADQQVTTFDPPR